MIVAVVSLVTAGCWTMYSPIPDIRHVRWKSITVNYATVEDSFSHSNVWSNSDPVVLNHLREALVVKSGCDLWGYGTMKSNRIALELIDGRKYELCITSDTGLCINDYDKAKTGWGLQITPQFEEALRQEIRSSEKIKW